MINCLFVGIGGFLGASFRYLLGLLPVPKTDFPYITFGINILGAFAIGIISALAAKYGLNDSRLILLLKTGVCGGFTTFSTFSLESSQLLSSGKVFQAALYMICSVLFCLAAVWLGGTLIKGR
ncbi:MAG: fluoride efflux transporter CrcB [Blautia sp.]|jgi:CrcB protein